MITPNNILTFIVIFTTTCHGMEISYLESHKKQLITYFYKASFSHFQLLKNQLQILDFEHISLGQQLTSVRQDYEAMQKFVYSESAKNLNGADRKIIANRISALAINMKNIQEQQIKTTQERFNTKWDIQLFNDPIAQRLRHNVAWDEHTLIEYVATNFWNVEKYENKDETRKTWPTCQIRLLDLDAIAQASQTWLTQILKDANDPIHSETLISLCSYYANKALDHVNRESCQKYLKKFIFYRNQNTIVHTTVAQLLETHDKYHETLKQYVLQVEDDM